VAHATGVLLGLLEIGVALMHVRYCDCDDCLPGFPAEPTAVYEVAPDAPPELPVRVKQTWVDRIKTRHRIYAHLDLASSSGV